MGGAHCGGPGSPVGPLILEHAVKRQAKFQLNSEVSVDDTFLATFVQPSTIVAKES